MKIHTVFTTRRDGDVRKKKFPNTIFAQQVHGNRIAAVSKDDRGKIIPAVDGLAYKHDKAVPVHLAVRVADCVPILAYDESAGVIGAAHAGWRGTVGNIAGNLISIMHRLGADPTCIHVSIGPHIGTCCYHVTDDRALAFQKKFGMNQMLMVKESGRWHLNLAVANRLALTRAGVLTRHIHTSDVCTACHSDIYFSYRKDLPRRQAGTKETFGEQMGVIWIGKR